MAEETLDVVAELSVEDRATRGLKTAAGSAGSLAKKFDSLLSGAGRLTGVLGVVGGALSLGKAIRGASEYVEHIHRISQLTGLSANRAAGLTEAFEESGLSLGETERVFLRMTRKQGQMEKATGKQVDLAKQFGINLAQGPEKALVKMGDLVQRGKIGSQHVAQILGVQGKQLVGTMDLLRKGGGEVASLIAKGRADNAHITDESVGGVDDMGDAIARVGRTWRRIASIILVNLAPGIEKMADGLEKHLAGWADGAQRFGKFLADHLDEAVGLAKAFGKVMVANWLTTKLTGAGLVSAVARAGKAAAAGGGGRAMARAAALGGGGGILPGLAGMLPALSGFGSVVAKAVPTLLKLSPWLLLAGIAAQIIADNWKEIYASLKPLFETVKRIWSNVSMIFQKILAIFKGLWSAVTGIFGENSTIGKFLANMSTPFEFLLRVIEGITEAFSAFLSGLIWLINKIPGVDIEDPAGAAGRAATERYERQAKGGQALSAYAETSGFGRALRSGKLTKKMFEGYAKKYEEVYGRSLEQELKRGGLGTKMAAATRKFGAKEGVPGAVVNQDFRGSRFEITQAFAEGFDPDRIAATFANDLASLGERRLQSGLAPVFSVR